jgi:hypothetical protein
VSSQERELAPCGVRGWNGALAVDFGIRSKGAVGC